MNSLFGVGLDDNSFVYSISSKKKEKMGATFIHLYTSGIMASVVH